MMMLLLPVERGRAHGSLLLLLLRLLLSNEAGVGQKQGRHDEDEPEKHLQRKKESQKPLLIFFYQF